MDPKLVALSEQIAAAAQSLATKQQTGVPIDMNSPDVLQLQAMFAEMQRGLQQQLDREVGEFKARFAELEQEATAAKAESGPLEVPDAGADLPVGTTTKEFKESHSPDHHTMHQVVHALLELGKADPTT